MANFCPRRRNKMRALMIAVLAFVSTAHLQAEAPQKKATISAQQSNWAVIPAQSSIGFSATHAGKTFKGVFRKWSAAIRFDPAKLDEANATVRIDLSSAYTGDKTYDKSLPEADWFNIKATPVATFQSQKFRTASPGKYVADGILTLRNVKVPVSLPFTLTIAGDMASMNGDVSLKRMAFGLGAESDAKGDWVSLDIPVSIKVVAKRVK
jgi:polyisoprenoid-binding protein YceI